MVRCEVIPACLSRVRSVFAVCIAAATLMIVTKDADARMYQWTNPDTGRVQLSGSPPAWYRGVHSGPRVFVFDNGELIDDTAVPVQETQRLELRFEAFGATTDSFAEAQPAANASDLRAALEKAAESGVDIDAVTSEFAEEQRLEAEADEERQADASAKADSLKALLEAWDLKQLEEARALLDLLPPEGDTVPLPAADY